LPWPHRLARGQLSRAWDETTRRSEAGPFAEMLYTDEASDGAIVEALTDVARISARIGIKAAAA